MPKSFWKSIASGIGPRGGSYELDRCNLQLQLIQNPPIHHSLFPRSPSSSSQSQSLSLSLSLSLSNGDRYRVPTAREGNSIREENASKLCY